MIGEQTAQLSDAEVASPARQAIYKFPEELASGIYPHVAFTVEQPDARQNGSVTIHMPLTQGITFGENGVYDTVSLGRGRAGADVVAAGYEGFTSGNGAVDSLAGMFSGAGREARSQLASLRKMEAIQLGATTLGANSQITSYFTSAIDNPNTRTTFSGNDIREFEFNFKAQAKSAEETRQLREIAFIFRKAVYASSSNNNLALSYPPLWQIKFYSSGAVENPYLPRILGGAGLGCYLISSTCTFNGSSNLWHTDGSPVDIDIRLRFRESQMLKLEDIENLMPELTETGSSKGEKRSKKSLVSSVKKLFSRNK